MNPNTPTPHMVRIRIGLTQEVATRLAQALTAAGFAAEIEYVPIPMLHRDLDGSGDYAVRVLDRHAAHGATWAQGYMAGNRGYQELLAAAEEASYALHNFHPQQHHMPVGRGICTWKPCQALFDAIAKASPSRDRAGAGEDHAKSTKQHR